MSFGANLERVESRHRELEGMLSSSEALNAEEITQISKELSELAPIAEKVLELRSIENELNEAKNMLSDNTDDELEVLIKSEINDLSNRLPILKNELQRLLLPRDEADEKNAILEVRAGTGGDEAALFDSSLFSMYQKYSIIKGWRFEILEVSETAIGGYKEAIASITGRSVFAKLKFESGVHRVQRVPETESQGRIHTSTCTVAILPEVEEVQDIQIDKNDLRVDTFRASGAGGQHVNKTDSAVRLTHIPSGLVVECQDGRSQHKNKEKALSLLASKLKQAEIESQQESIASERKILVGTGDRSEKIRTYNFPQGRMTDHRIKLTQHNLDQIMDGDIKSICDALLAENQLAMLSQLESE